MLKEPLLHAGGREDARGGSLEKTYSSNVEPTVFLLSLFEHPDDGPPAVGHVNEMTSAGAACMAVVDNQCMRISFSNSNTLAHAGLDPCRVWCCSLAAIWCCSLGMHGHLG